jgi:CheY-like chemotaxis protein
MSQPNTSSDDRLRRISELLKNADRYVLAGEFDKAREQVEQVFSIDPDNLYAKAYLSRIEVFRSKSGDTSAPAEPAVEPPPEVPAETVTKEPEEHELIPETTEPDTEHEEEMPPVEAGENDLEPEAQSEIEPEAEPETEPETESPPVTEPVPEPEMEPEEQPLIQKAGKTKLTSEEQRRLVERIVAEEQKLLEDPLPDEQAVTPPIIFSAPLAPEELRREANEKEYRTTLEKYWRKGSLSAADREKLEELRAALEIGDEQHLEIERSVKLASYVNAVKDAWQDGLITPTGAAALDDLRDRFSISIDEHLMIESRIMYELHGLKARGVIMVVDDDVELVKIIKSILREGGFATFSAHSPEQALPILERTTPDLILLDVTFPKPSISGFTMYERIRQRPRLRFVPVIFLSGLDEEHIVQVGKKLGADDYIVKPCSEEMLISSIEGKIKRYKEMRKMIDSDS